ncbi:LapA family protein [Brasilonema octagenarum UFV-E1]|uniref:LapA family protein n=1 Tax=Brasilonema sennae CENA114 TaxID=415709 RepID=A0A856M7Z3_9CYAN|nr:LapA family protein [Brasilonema sennae]QDL07263.1 LapA family protein [Brasilonema sennae CENA114]QDL13627.1 LapA family protein [Brasilonema octagenarum UFV-E1]
MAVFRLFLLMTVLGGLTLLVVQNLSPVLPLVFLGMKSKALPLAIWILFSTTAGAFTTVFVTSLFNFSNFFAGQQRQTPVRTATTSTAKSQTPKEEPTPRPSPSSSSRKSESTRNSDPLNDWETDNSTDDWDFEEKKEQAPTPNSQNTQVRDSKTYEPQQQPSSTNKSDSAYSYSYREPKNSGVGKTESVYDADYRVIIPPYQPPTTNQAQTNQAQDDDWGFLDEDIEDQDKRPRR